MPVGATIAAVGTVAGAAIGAAGAKSAANQQASALNNAEQLQLQMFGTAKDTLQPFVNAGSGAIPALQKLLGLSTGGGAAPTAGGINYDALLKANPDIAAWAAAGHGDPSLTSQTPEQAAAYWVNQHQGLGDDYRALDANLPHFTAADVAGGGSNSIEDFLQNLPGYQFVRDQGVQSINRSIGSTGQTGAQIKGIARFVTGLADQTYGGQVQRLQSAVNTGESAAAQTGQIGAQQAGGISNTIVGAGTAQAAGTVGAANAISSGLSSIPNALLVNRLFPNGSSSGGGSTIYAGTNTPNQGPF